MALFLPVYGAVFYQSMALFFLPVYGSVFCQSMALFLLVYDPVFY